LERVLIDGGVIDPLPVRVLAKMGVKKIIAVNVLPNVEDRIEQNRFRRERTRRWLELSARKGIGSKMMSRWLHKLSNKYSVNVFNVIMNTIQFMEYELAETWGRQADVLIHAVENQGHWAEFYSPDKFIKMGKVRAEEQVEAIKQLLVE